MNRSNTEKLVFKKSSYTSRHKRRIARQQTLLELRDIFVKARKKLGNANDSHLNRHTDNKIDNIVSHDLHSNDRSTSITRLQIDQFNELDISDEFLYSYSDNEFCNLYTETVESENCNKNHTVYETEECNNMYNKKQFLDEFLNSENQKNNDDSNHMFETDLHDWATSFKINLNAFSSLLTLLSKHTQFKLPKDARTFLKTPQCTDISRIENGEYCHFGLKNAIERIIKKRWDRNCSSHEIELLICTDGAPIGSSSTQNLWPIMCCDTIIKQVEIIGIYSGEGKPKNCNEFLEQFVNEAVILVNNGILYNTIQYTVRIRGIICDAPAKAYVLNVKCHSGYSSCSKCLIHGEYINGTICFPITKNEIILRNDFDFNRLAYQDDYQKDDTILRKILNLGLVSGIPLDYMHLVCLGVMRKLIILWLKGPLSTRLCSKDVQIISDRLKALRNCVPNDFMRKPRSLDCIKYWKATEFRQFLLYTGCVVLKDILSHDAYYNFLTLHVTISILVNPTIQHHPEYITYASELLNHFVTSFEKIYGARYVSYNVHNLLHLSNDVKEYGSLDSFSAFPFESFICSLKNLIRKGEKPLQQISRRLKEYNFNLIKNVEIYSNIHLEKKHRDGPVTNDRHYQNQYKILRHGNLYINCDNEANNCVILKDGSIITVLNFAKSENVLYAIGKKLSVLGSFYEIPCKSEKFGIKLVDKTSSIITSWLCEEIYAKAYRIAHVNKEIVFPILHTLSY